MSLPWRVPAVLIPLLLPASAASAHSAIEGIGEFYNGILHPLVVPAHLVTLVPLGLLIGQQGIRGIKLQMPAFMVSVGVGLAGAYFGLGVSAAPPMLIGAATYGLLVAIAADLPLGVCLVLVVSGGLLVGLDSVPEAAGWQERGAALFGSGIGASLVVLYAAGLAEYLSRPWQRVLVRIVGSWSTAVAIMVLALSSVGSGAATGG